MKHECVITLQSSVGSQASERQSAKAIYSKRPKTQKSVRNVIRLLCPYFGMPMMECLSTVLDRYKRWIVNIISAFERMTCKKAALNEKQGNTLTPRQWQKVTTWSQQLLSMERWWPKSETYERKWGIFMQFDKKGLGKLAKDVMLMSKIEFFVKVHVSLIILRTYCAKYYNVYAPLVFLSTQKCRQSCWDFEGHHPWSVFMDYALK